MNLVLVCSLSGRSVADGLAARLTRNLGVATQVIADNAPIAETWEEGALAGGLVLLLDEVTAPKPFVREDWKGLLQHLEQRRAPAVAFVKLADCGYPALLERRNFYAAGDERAVERWAIPMLRRQPALIPEPTGAAIPEEWWAQLVDQPGRLTVSANMADAVQEFAHRAATQFQSVAWVGCARRTRDAIQGEVRHLVRGERTLVVLAHEKPGFVFEEGRHSLIGFQSPRSQRTVDHPLAAAIGACYAPVFPERLVRQISEDGSTDLNEFAVLLHAGRGLWRARESFASTPEARQRHFALVSATFAQWRKLPDPCRALLYEAQGAATFGFDHDWAAAVDLCQRAAYVLATEDRKLEQIAFLQMLAEQAGVRGDTAVYQSARHELSWLTGSFADEPVRTEFVAGEQMGFEF